MWLDHGEQVHPLFIRPLHGANVNDKDWVVTDDTVCDEGCDHCLCGGLVSIGKHANGVLLDQAGHAVHFGLNIIDKELLDL
jgi:hypothetical protein